MEAEAFGDPSFVVTDPVDGVADRVLIGSVTCRPIAPAVTVVDVSWLVVLNTHAPALPRTSTT